MLLYKISTLMLLLSQNHVFMTPPLTTTSKKGTLFLKTFENLDSFALEFLGNLGNNVHASIDNYPPLHKTRDQCSRSTYSRFKCATVTTIMEFHSCNIFYFIYATSYYIFLFMQYSILILRCSCINRLTLRLILWHTKLMSSMWESKSGECKL